jgi:hypothetical protein
MTKISVICQCGNTEYEEGTIEINFRDRKIIYVCPKCNRINTMELALPEEHHPYPRTGRCR